MNCQKSQRMNKMISTCMAGIGAESIDELVAEMNEKILEITDDDEDILMVLYIVKEIIEKRINTLQPIVEEQNNL